LVRDSRHRRDDALSLTSRLPFASARPAGTPDVTTPAIIAAWLPAVAALHRRGAGVMAVHEYDSPYLWNCYSNSSDDGWTMGRYRKLYDEYLAPAGLGNTTLVVTETGVDNSPCPSPNLGGWQAYCGFWQNADWGADCAHSYVSQLAWYDSLLRADDYVLGSTIFCYQ